MTKRVFAVKPSQSGYACHLSQRVRLGKKPKSVQNKGTISSPFFVLLSFATFLSRKKSRENPTCGFPSFRLLRKHKFTLSGAYERLGVSPVATGDRGSASGHRKLFEKSLTKNFQCFMCCFLLPTFLFQKKSRRVPIRIPSRRPHRERRDPREVWEARTYRGSPSCT